MIYATVMYGIRCNRCRVILENDEGYSSFDEKHDACTEAHRSGWQSFYGIGEAKKVEVMSETELPF